MAEEKTKEEQDLQNRLYQSIGFEVAANTAVDAATGWLMPAPPVYAGVNFVASGAINTLAQLWRQDDNFSWGEVGASSAIGIVPGLGGKGVTGIAKATVKGAGLGVAHESIRVGVDEQRLLTPEEVAGGALLGGAFGGGTKVIGDSVGVLAKHQTDKIATRRAKGSYTRPGTYTDRTDIWKPDDLTGPPKTYERFQQRRAYPKAYGTESPMWMDPSDVPPALGEEARNIARKTDLRMKLEDIIDENPRGTFRNKPIYESTLEENFQPTLKKSRESFGGKEGYQTKATTLTSQADTRFSGLSVSGIANEKLAESQFRYASRTAKNAVQKQTPFKGTLPPDTKGVRGQKLTNGYRAHHETPLLASSELKEGLKPQYAKELDLYVLEEGVPQGHLIENVTIIPHDFHLPILHRRMMDIQLGGKGDLTAIMKKRYPGKQIWQLELWERKVVADDLVATVNEAREWTYDFYRTVAALKDKTPTLSNLDIDTIIQAISQSDRFELDEVINKMAGGPNKRTSVAFQFKTKFYKDFEDAVIDEILMGKRGSKFLEDILLKQKNGYQILEAVVFGNQRPAVAIKNIGIKDIDAIQLQLALDTTTPAQMQRIMKAYGKGGKGGIKQ